MKTVVFSMMAFAALFFVSCSNDNDHENELPVIEDGRVVFSSGVTAIQSRVGGTDGDLWDGGEQIGLYMVKRGTSDVVDGKKNVMYTGTTSADKKSATFTSASPIYYPVGETDKVDFIAYHPYQVLTDFTFNVSVTDQSSQSNIDLMVARADNAGTGYDKGQGTTPVNLVFKHQLAKVIINVTNGKDVSTGELATLSVVTFNGMSATAVFDISDPNTGFTDPGAVVSIQALKPNAGVQTYEAILLPVALANTHIVKFATKDGSFDNLFEWTMTDNAAISGDGSKITALEGGKKYNFNVTLQKTNVVVTGEIGAWNPVGEYSGIAQ